MRRKTRAWLLPLTLAAWAAGAEPVRAEPQPSYEEVVAAAQAKAALSEWAAAAAALEPALPRFSQDFPIHLSLAYYRLRAGEYARAIDAYRAALAIESDSFEARLGLADAYLGAERWASAEPLTAELAKARPEPEVLNRHAFVLRKRGRPEEALAWYRRSLERAPGDPDARLGLAWTFLEADRPAEARAAFAQLLEEDSENASARQGLKRADPRRSPRASAFGFVQFGGGEALLGLVAGAGTGLGGGWSADVTLRHIGELAQGGGRAAIGQNEGYLAVSAPWASFGRAGLVGGFVLAPKGGGPSAPRTAWMAGLEAEETSLVGLAGAALVSGYSDARVYQGQLKVPWRIVGALHAEAGLRAQLLGESLYPAALLGLGFYPRGWGLKVAGEYGSQRRMVDLEAMTVYNLDGELDARIQVKLHKSIFGSASLQGSYDYELYGSAALHRVCAGLALSL